MAENPDGVENGERQSLLKPQKSEGPNIKSIVKFVLALTGIYLANADSSLFLATYASVASTFHRSTESSWLLTIYTFGYIVVLPVTMTLQNAKNLTRDQYGASSDNFGHKKPLLAAYILFCLGCAVSHGTVPAAISYRRMVSGMGASGLMTMVTIIITVGTDTVPLSQVAILRSYVNLAAILGRGSGAPIGGLLFDLIGWRWSVLAQLPVATICLLVASFQSLSNATQAPKSRPRKRSLDIPGLLTFASTIFSFLVLLDTGTRADGSRDSLIIVSAVVFVFFGAAFLLLKAYWASRPMIPLSLVRKPSVGLQYLVQMLCMLAQFTLVSNIATYFIRTNNASHTEAALHVALAPMGNAIGALIGGMMVQRMKRCKALTMSASTLSIASIVLMALRWRQPIDVWESLYIFPAAMGVGLLNVSQFVALSAAVEKEQLAITTSMFFLSLQLGMLLGASGSAALLKSVFRGSLFKTLGSDAETQQVIKDILSDTRIGPSLPHKLQDIVRSSYLRGFFAISILSLCSSALTFPFLALLPEQYIE